LNQPAEVPEKPPFRSGYIAVLGPPNVGKSSLVNRLTGKKVSGVSPRPQTTRRRLLGIRTEETCQMVFVDTPGYSKSNNMLGEMMNRAATATAGGSDLVLYLVDAAAPEDGTTLKALLKGLQAPVFLVINKVDIVDKPSLLPMMEKFGAMADFKHLVPISALRSDGTDLLADLIRECLPPGPKWFEGGNESMDISVIIQEIVQEKLFSQVRQEVPYGCAVRVETTERSPALLRIEAVIIAERESHKGIIIGKGAQRLKSIGTAARMELEKALGCHIFLGLRVKVEEDWRNRESLLTGLGYDIVSPMVGHGGGTGADDAHTTS